MRDLIVVGNCTDLCVYTLAMHLRLRANTYNLKKQRVIVPANAVDTFDMSVDVARNVGGMATLVHMTNCAPRRQCTYNNQVFIKTA